MGTTFAAQVSVEHWRILFGVAKKRIRNGVIWLWDSVLPSHQFVHCCLKSSALLPMSPGDFARTNIAAEALKG